MIYIHAENLGLYDDLINTFPLADATAKDFSWRIRLSTQDFSKDFTLTIVEMPNDMALSLFWWYMEKETPNQLSAHLDALLKHDAMKESIVTQLEYSVALLDKARNIKVGRPFFDYDANMAKEIEDHIEYGFEKELYALLDAKGFEKFCEVEE